MKAIFFHTGCPTLLIFCLKAVFLTVLLDGHNAKNFTTFVQPTNAKLSRKRTAVPFDGVESALENGREYGQRRARGAVKAKCRGWLCGLIEPFQMRMLYAAIFIALQIVNFMIFCAVAHVHNTDKINWFWTEALDKVQICNTTAQPLQPEAFYIATNNTSLEKLQTQECAYEGLCKNGSCGTSEFKKNDVTRMIFMGYFGFVIVSNFAMLAGHYKYKLWPESRQGPGCRASFFASLLIFMATFPGEVNFQVLLGPNCVLIGESASNSTSLEYPGIWQCVNPFSNAWIDIIIMSSWAALFGAFNLVLYYDLNAQFRRAQVRRAREERNFAHVGTLFMLSLCYVPISIKTLINTLYYFLFCLYSSRRFFEIF